MRHRVVGHLAVGPVAARAALCLGLRLGHRSRGNPPHGHGDAARQQSAFREDPPRTHGEGSRIHGECRVPIPSGTESASGSCPVQSRLTVNGPPVGPCEADMRPPTRRTGWPVDPDGRWLGAPEQYRMKRHRRCSGVEAPNRESLLVHVAPIVPTALENRS
jgi:hypothetical protein